MDGISRGDVVTIALQGDYGKPRPALVIQSDLFNPTHPTVTILPITSDLRDAPLFRLTVDPTSLNGLRKGSQIMVDKPMTVQREKIGQQVGRMDHETLVRVDRALMVWLGMG